jgi:L-methionine (R)-S-oxide reductase
MPPALKDSDIKQELSQLSQKAATADELMSAIVQLLHTRLPNYNWVGFYLLEQIPGSQPMLALGPFQGAPTPHTRIPLNQGICGAAASSGQTVVVDDVAADPRYLSCSIETKSEIVAPVFVHGIVVGELDIDSHSPAAFGAEDRQLAEYAAAMVGKHLEKTRA